MATLFFFYLFILFSIPTVFLFLEVIAAVLFRAQKTVQPSTIINNSKNDIAVAVLVPAHNEELVIGTTLDQLSSQLQHRDRLLVVADNCSDKTASIALSKNAEVIERHDEQKRGKGYALDYGIQFLRRNPPDVVIMIDADANVAPGTISVISKLAYLTNRPIQPKNLLTPPDKAESTSSISAFAFLFKNFIRPTGLTQLGGGCLLTGTGMAFTWNGIEKADLASGNIVEDMQLGLDLAIEGFTPMYCQEALVTSEMAPTRSAAKTQRTRWEQGHLKTLLTQTFRLFREAIKQRRLDLVLQGLEVSIPPLASFSLLLGTVFLAALTFSAFGAIPWSLAFWFGFLIALLLLSILTGWFFFGRDILSFRQIFTIPFYIIWKIPIYIGFIIRRESKWEKTQRKKF